MTAIFLVSVAAADGDVCVGVMPPDFCRFRAEIFVCCGLRHLCMSSSVVPSMQTASKGGIRLAGVCESMEGWRIQEIPAAYTGQTCRIVIRIFGTTQRPERVILLLKYLKDQLDKTCLRQTTQASANEPLISGISASVTVP